MGVENLRRRFPTDKLYSSVAVPGTHSEPGYSPVYRNAASPDSLVQNLGEDLSTLHALFQNAVDLFGEDDCLGERLRSVDGTLDQFYTYQSYNTIDSRRLDVASGLIQLVRARHGKKDFVVGVSGANCIEMVLTDLATRSFSVPNTGLYDSLSDEAAAHILKLTGSPVLVINVSLLPKFLRLKPQLPSLTMVVTFEAPSVQSIQEADSMGIQLLSFSSVEQYGKEHRLPPDYSLPTPSTLYTLAFTSGTTGMPKGVFLTHANATANVTGFIVHCPKPAVALSEAKMADFKYNRDAEGNQLRSLCFLPLLHNYEKSITNFELSYGIALALPSKTGTASLFEDLPLVQPSLFTGVPRVFTVVESRMKSFISTLHQGADVGEAVRKEFGLKNVSYLMCASAPISKESIIFFKETLKCGFLNSYGSTECFSVVSFSDPYDLRAGSSGPIGVNSEIRLKDVPEMGYTHLDKPHPRGEIMVRGACCFSHYFKNEEATKSALDEQGWYHSGDIAAMDEEGNLFIIDRAKNFFKLSQGEYVTPEKVETIYLSKNPVLTQLFVHGDSYSNYLIGIAGVDLNAVRQQLSAVVECKGWSNDDVLKLLQVPKVKKYVLEMLNQNLRDTGLQGYEKLHNLHFELQPLSVENESLTPSFKLKRNSARKVHGDKIKGLYEEGSLIKRSKI